MGWFGIQKKKKRFGIPKEKKKRKEIQTKWGGFETDQRKKITRFEK